MERYSLFLGRKNQYCENDYRLPKAIYRFNAIPIKLPMAFFTELEQNILKFIQKHKRPNIAKAVLRKNNGAGGDKLPDFRLYYKATVINSMVLTEKQKHRPMKQDRKPRNKPMHLWVAYFLTKEARIYNGGKDSLFNKWCWEN